MKKTTFPKVENSDRDMVLDYTARRYGTTADYPWHAVGAGISAPAPPADLPAGGKAS